MTERIESPDGRPHHWEIPEEYPSAIGKCTVHGETKEFPTMPKITPKETYETYRQFNGSIKE